MNIFKHTNTHTHTCHMARHNLNDSTNKSICGGEIVFHQYKN